MHLGHPQEIPPSTPDFQERPRGSILLQLPNHPGEDWGLILEGLIVFGKEGVAVAIGVQFDQTFFRRSGVDEDEIAVGAAGDAIASEGQQ
jgi:hypothetical protein